MTGPGEDTSALAGLDDPVAFPPHPVFDAVAEQLGGDPRGTVRVKDWEEIGYVGGGHGRRDGDGASPGGGNAGGGA